MGKHGRDKNRDMGNGEGRRGVGKDRTNTNQRKITGIAWRRAVLSGKRYFRRNTEERKSEIWE
jgi:hypothetical protein